MAAWAVGWLGRTHRWRRPVVLEPGQGEEVRSIKGRGDEGVHCVSVSGRKAPGREHGLVGLRPRLAPPPHARHHDEHEHDDDDDQEEKKHVPLLPATSGWLAAVGG
jgi:hypothetical protein